jgi:hypothetical protein
MVFKFRSDKPEVASKKITDFVTGRDDWFVVEIQRAKENRTLPQNKYYWGVVVKIIAQHTGYTSEETHQVLAAMFLSYESNGRTFVRSTTKLNTVEFSDYSERCRTWAQTEMDVYIPLPNEITQDMHMMLNNIFERP